MGGQDPRRGARNDRGQAGLGDSRQRPGRRQGVRAGRGHRLTIENSGATSRTGPVAFEAVDRIFREESGRVIAGLIRAVGDFDLAEESVQDAFVSALAHWPAEGLPPNPGAWIATTARRKAIDRLRRAKRLDQKTEALALLMSSTSTDTDPADLTGLERPPIDDDRLRLIFTCCHPALAVDAQYRVPAAEDLQERLGAVLHVLYLVFNEGYSATSGAVLVRRQLAAEAIRLTRVLAALMPEQPEVLGLLSLMLLQDSRRDARQSDAGELIVLSAQDRGRWDAARIAEGLATLERASALGGLGEAGPYALQAAIAAEHARAVSADATNWPRIVALYDELLALLPSPVVGLNRAVAVAQAFGPERGLALVDELGASGELAGYHLWHSTRGELLTRLARQDEAADAFRGALDLAINEVDRRHLARRLEQLLN